VLIELNEGQIIGQLRSATGSVVLITMPNYETRSTFALRNIAPELRKLAVDKLRGRILLIRLGLRGEGPKDVLKELSESQSNQTSELLQTIEARKAEINVRYPILDENRLIGDLRRTFGMVTRSYDVYIDISCMPRRVVLTLLTELLGRGNGVRQDINSVTVLYTWADRYPGLIYPESYGVSDTFFSGSMMRAFEASLSTSAVIFAGGPGYESRLVYEQLTDPQWEDKVRSRRIFFLMYRDNPMQSLNDLIANQQLLREAALHGDAIEFCFSPADASRRLAETVSEVISQDNLGRHLFLIAPFGPKPLTVAAFDAVLNYRREIGRRGVDAEADIVLMSRTQYTSVYSIGARQFSGYRVVVWPD
jgi:hypothetical protein